MSTDVTLDVVRAAALAAILALASTVAFCQAAPPERVNYQGVLRDAAGTLLTGPVTMTFRFYDDPAAGSLLWEEVYDAAVHPPQLAVSAGLFSVALGDPAHRNGGSETAFADVFANRAGVYLGVAVEGDAEMTPRIKAVAAPFALNSAKLEGRGASTFAASLHGHAESDVAGLVDDLAGKAPAVHGHTSSDLTDFSVATPADGQVLVWDTGAWVNVNPWWLPTTGGTLSGDLVFSQDGDVIQMGAPTAGHGHSFYGHYMAASNPVVMWGYNIKPDYTLDVPAERGAFFGIEGDYDDGSGNNKVEFYAQYNVADSFDDYRRFLMCQYDKVTNIVRGTFLTGGSENGLSLNVQDGTETGDEKVGGRARMLIGATVTQSLQDFSLNEGFILRTPTIRVAGDLDGSSDSTYGGHIFIRSGQADAALNGIEWKASATGSGYGFRAATHYAGDTQIDWVLQTRQNSHVWHDALRVYGTGVVSAKAFEGPLAGTASNADAVDGQHAEDFLNTSSAAQTKAGKLVLASAGDYGIESSGTTAGGWFRDSDGGAYALLGYGGQGINAAGPGAGGSFDNTSASGYALLAPGDYGIQALGNEMGGYFQSSSASGYAEAGSGDFGVRGFGTEAGGYFADLATGAGFARVGQNSRGINAVGARTAGYFANTASGTYAKVASRGSNILSTGKVAFVQNHPSDGDRVIVYASPEGDEVATYTRGTAKLVSGEARVKLGETFQWVTNPDIGLTAHLTARGKAVPLAVTSLSSAEISVVGPEDVTFDYLVCGLRIGFEESSVVQEKRQESYIPSTKDHQDLYAKYPELRAFNALERFKGMESEVRGVSPEALDLSRAKALREAIHEYDAATDPPVYELLGHGPGPVRREAGEHRIAGDPQPLPATRAPAAASQRTETASGQDSPAEARTAAPGAAAPFPPAERFPVSKSVSAGDVLVMTLDGGEVLHPCAAAADPMVVGVALQEAREGIAPVAASGYAEIKADATSAPIAKGDLLVTSPLPGHAMKAPRPAEQGTVIGKALEPLESGTGVIKVLVMLR